MSHVSEYRSKHAIVIRRDFEKKSIKNLSISYFYFFEDVTEDRVNIQRKLDAFIKFGSIPFGYKIYSAEIIDCSMHSRSRYSTEI